jgi:hypothetical protein
MWGIMLFGEKIDIKLNSFLLILTKNFTMPALSTNMALVNSIKKDIYWHNVSEVCEATKKLILEFNSLDSRAKDYYVLEFLRRVDIYATKIDRVIKTHGLRFIGGPDDIFENMIAKADFLLRIVRKKTRY